MLAYDAQLMQCSISCLVAASNVCGAGGLAENPGLYVSKRRDIVAASSIGKSVSATASSCHYRVWRVKRKKKAQKIRVKKTLALKQLRKKKIWREGENKEEKRLNQ